MLSAGRTARHLSTLRRNLYTVKLGPGYMSTPLPAARFPLPPKRKEYQNRHTIVLDVDEALVSTTGCTTVLRPHVIPFLRKAAELFEVVVFSAGIHCYVAGVLAAIEHAGYAIDSKPVLGSNAIVMARESMIYPTKHLAWLGRPFESVIHVDDYPTNFENNPRHGIWIRDFTVGSIPDNGKLIAHHPSPGVYYGLGHDCFQIFQHDSTKYDKDDALLKLMPLLQSLHGSSNVVKELDFWRPSKGAREGQDNFKVTDQRNVEAYVHKTSAPLAWVTAEAPKWTKGFVRSKFDDNWGAATI